MADFLKDRRMEIAKKALSPKPSQPFDINVMEPDPANPGGQRVMISTKPGHWYSEGDALPGGGSYEASKNRAITYLPGQGGGEPFDIRMGDHAPKEPRPQEPRHAPMWWQRQGNTEHTEPTGATLDWMREQMYPESAGMSAQKAGKIDNQNQRDALEIQVRDANFPDPRTDRAVMDAVEDMLDEQFVGLKLLRTSEEHEDGIPDNIYFEAGDGSVWEWNSNGEIHRAD